MKALIANSKAIEDYVLVDLFLDKNLGTYSQADIEKSGIKTYKKQYGAARNQMPESRIMAIQIKDFVTRNHVQFLSVKTTA